ncbi:MAG: UDP-N-acetylglucosamine 1-carboxyvinyltransferase [Parcubacteria group bacterium GW2011_GWC1_42_11]|uniref:UDP-N-acetylglucosamine 1-carboxyvinyltransferase n=1 Tax=Candidatus Nomurabacteria bacterium GW2011_GWC2_42_20 TaxID=1618756 RepID=A0A0G0ZG22_9BACT|nr:MAG: UDP-N-acetylglucosamine 1-carboxyvinyltransferase [Parcubacteria group bacterium GW2011_GWC1_42_11]KKS47614.1 MAG: UDP-N-acetylglucosamine 1-carboxyvinyltransferase [Candidatus Nomurabacteria bacterium GW2011_GWC2_42_20]TAN36847.1 MAG: UDP-N-acetylglucosamine 1-carboxyvinyltransferase [Patescibacteria group bacterium]HBH71476.1 UDP-N-acetylglucosamine 1-carboxyvinyltransferase [Candidatus Yonathbacteria bacterium]
MSNTFVIKGFGGERKLHGKVSITGAKNAALKAIASTVLFRDTVTLTNIPEINDTFRMFDLLKDMGADVVNLKHGVYTVLIPRGFATELSPGIAKRMRSSIVLTGPVLARYGKVSFPHPGGCVIGARPLDLFVDGFEKMGAKVSVKDDSYVVEAKDGLKGAEFFLKNQSVTVTETFMMAGVLASGSTIIKNAAMEPEIADLAQFLNKCGAKIIGAGTPTIIIKGGKLLAGARKPYKTMPDRIEAGSFLVLGALASRELHITNCNPAHLESPIELLRSAGVSIETKKTEIIVRAPSKLRAVDVKTHEYPGFPTDLQAPMTVLLTQAEGESKVFETIFEGRLNYTESLSAMGASITMMDPHRVLVRGKSELRGRKLTSPDLRAGLAFVIAAVVAKGESVIHNVDTTIDRGYEDIENRLRAIGVEIERAQVLSESV